MMSELHLNSQSTHDPKHKQRFPQKAEKWQGNIHQVAEYVQTECLNQQSLRRRVGRESIQNIFQMRETLTMTFNTRTI